jgi:hypothetical protein
MTKAVNGQYYRIDQSYPSQQQRLQDFVFRQYLPLTRVDTNALCSSADAGHFAR